MKFNPDFLDKYGMVLPSKRHEDKPADNGVLFTSIAVMLGFDFNYVYLIRSCFIKDGLVARWNGNIYDDVAFDDYLGIAATCIHLRETKIPREILWYGITHGFVFNTNSKLSANDWLGRHVHVWLLMWCAAFPFMKLFFKYPLKLVTVFFKSPQELLAQNNSSGLQLQWVFIKGCEALGFNFDKYNQHHTYQTKMFQQYYSVDHPFNNLTTEGDKNG